MSGGRKQELEVAFDIDLLKRAFAGFVREIVDAALKERLPQGLRLDPRRPPQVAGGTPEPLGPQYLSRQQVAQITGYSMRTIARLIESGKLVACGPRRDRITRYEVDRMMAKREEEGGADVADEDADVTAAVDAVFGVIK